MIGVLGSVTDRLQKSLNDIRVGIEPFKMPIEREKGSELRLDFVYKNSRSNEFFVNSTTGIYTKMITLFALVLSDCQNLNLLNS